MNNTMIENIKNNLSILKIKNSFENIDEYLENVIKNKISLYEFLDLLLQREAQSKINRSVENQIEMAGFPSRKTFELFDFNFQPNLDLDKINDLKTLRFIENGENVVFMGTPAVGKTHLAIALDIESISHKYSTYFINSYQLIQNLLKANHENRLD